MTIERDARGWWVVTTTQRIGPFTTASGAALFAATGIGRPGT
jgi:hypothetical protein